MPTLPHYKVVAAIIEYGGKFLCVQKGESRYAYLSHCYEFPGGKMEPGETPGQALVREIREELDLDIVVLEPLSPVHHEYPEFSIELIPFLCRTGSPTITLREHIDYMWLSVDELHSLNWAAADVPVVRELEGRY